MTYITPLESKFLEDRSKIPMCEWGVLQQRIRKKARKLKDKSISRALNLISEEERMEIAEQILLSLSMDLIVKVTKMREEYLTEIEIKEYVRKKYGINLDPKEIKKILKTKIKNNSYLNKKIKKIINSKDFVLNRKILRDKVYIQFTTKKIFRDKLIVPSKIYLFNKIKESKKRIKINSLIKGKPRYKIILKEFYERGIILPQETSKEDFINKCRKIILKTPHKKNTHFPKIIYPFKYKKEDKEKFIRLNSYYKHFNFSAYS